MVFQKMLPIWRACDLPPADFADKSDWDQFWAECPWNPRKYGAQQDEQYSAKKLWVHFHYSREFNVYAGIAQSRLDPVPATTEQSENALPIGGPAYQEDARMDLRSQQGPSSHGKCENMLSHGN